MLSLSKHASCLRGKVGPLGGAFDRLRLSGVGIMVLQSTLLAACAQPEAPAGFAATLPVPPPVAKPADGAIFSAATGYAPLIDGRRARAVGDVLTIVLLESTSTSKGASADTKRGGNAGITPPSVGPLSFLDPEALKLGRSASFNGAGNAAQTNSLTGAIAVTIVEVRPNGTALVRGEKRMLLSQGEEWIQFAGIVRLADVDADNRIASSRVADARIEYAGNGAVQRASRPGWFARFFDAVSPF